MDRRNFFQAALSKGGKIAVDVADAHIKKQASRWIRPPFAINEIEFLLGCTRCTDCIDACPQQLIFALSTKMGAKFAGTPALDLLNNSCLLCEDWPCVTACTPHVLVHTIEESDEKNDTTKINDITLPKLARASINTERCLPFSGPECGACIDSCPIDGALTLDITRPVINDELCTGCAICRENCITEPKAINITSL